VLQPQRSGDWPLVPDGHALPHLLRVPAQPTTAVPKAGWLHVGASSPRARRPQELLGHCTALFQENQRRLCDLERHLRQYGYSAEFPAAHCRAPGAPGAAAEPAPGAAATDAGRARTRLCAGRVLRVRAFLSRFLSHSFYCGHAVGLAGQHGGN